MIRFLVVFLALTSAAFGQFYWSTPGTTYHGSVYWVGVDVNWGAADVTIYKNGSYHADGSYGAGNYTQDFGAQTVEFSAVTASDTGTEYVSIVTGGASPTISINAPSSLSPGQVYNVSISVADSDADLNSMGIRWQGHGLVGGPWMISGDSASDSTTLTAPSVGPVFLRGDVWDHNNHGIVTEWVEVPVVIPTYSLTVNYGSGSGSYEAGTSVTIDADAPDAGYQFAYWNHDSGSGTISYEYSATTTFTMGAGPATVTAHYQDIPESPTADMDGDSSGTTGNAVALTYAAEDPDSDLRRWRVSLLPNTAQWTNISGGNQTGQFSYTFGAAGSYTFRLEVQDWYGNTHSDDHTVNILPPPPSITSDTTVYATTGSPFSYTITASNSPTSFGASSLPAGLTRSGAVISGTPTGMGDQTVTLTASNSGGSNSTTLLIVLRANQPAVEISPDTDEVYESTSILFAATGGNGTGAYQWGGSTSGSGTSKSVTFNTAGAQTVTVFRDGDSYYHPSNTATASITVNQLPDEPQITSAATVSATTGSPFSYTITATNSPTAFGASPLPAGLTLNGATISGTPTGMGNQSITLSASNDGGTGYKTLTVNLRASQAPVSVTPSSQTISAGATLSFTASGGSGTGVYHWGLDGSGTGTNKSVQFPTSGTRTVSVYRAGDGNYHPSTVTVATITVNSVPPPVVSSPTTASGALGESFSYSITGTNSPTGFSASGLPPGLVVNTATGIISGTPTQAGSYSVLIAAANYGGTDTETLDLAVAKGTPNLTLTNQSVDYPAVLMVTSAMLPSQAQPPVAGLPVPQGTVSYSAQYVGGTFSAFSPATFPYGLHPWEGPFTITASYPGDANYVAATKTATFVTRDVAPPPAPSAAPQLQLLGANSFSVSWYDSLDDATSVTYDISVDDGATVHSSTPRTVAGVSGLTPSTTYLVRVRAKDAFGNLSAWTAPASITTAASGQDPASTSPWMDVNGDGIRDEIFTAGTAAFSHSVVETDTQTYTVAEWELNFGQTVVYIIDGQIYYYYSWMPEMNLETYDITTNVVRPEALILAEAGYEYGIYRARTPTDFSVMLPPSVLNDAPPGSPGIIFPHLFGLWPAEVYYNTPLVLARIGKMPHSARVVTSSGTILGTTVLGNTKEEGGVITTAMPASGSQIVHILDDASNAITSGNNIAWEIWNAVTNAQKASGTGNLLDIGLVAGVGDWHISIRIDEAAAVWFKMKIHQQPTVQILNAGKNSTSTLNVAKMTDDGVLWVDGLVVLDPEGDSDRFYVRVIDPSRRGQKPRVVVWTESESGYSDDGELNLGSNQVELDDDPNDPTALISKSMLLVSDDPDDDHKVNGVTDNELNDRTRKVALGGKVRVEYLGQKASGTYTSDVHAEVPVRTGKPTVHLNVVILRDVAESEGGELVTTPSSVQADLKNAQERFAQVGVKLTWSITHADPPPSVDLSDGLLVKEYPDEVPLEARALISALGTTNSTADIHIFYVTSPVIGATLTAGHAFGDYSVGVSHNAFTYNAVVAKNRGAFVLAHEIGHLLTDAGHLEEGAGLNQNLMAYIAGTASKAISRPKRLNQSQKEAILSGPHTNN